MLDEEEVEEEVRHSQCGAQPEQCSILCDTDWPMQILLLGIASGIRGMLNKYQYCPNRRSTASTTLVIDRG